MPLSVRNLFRGAKKNIKQRDQSKNKVDDKDSDKEHKWKGTEKQQSITCATSIASSYVTMSDDLEIGTIFFYLIILNIFLFNVTIVSIY